MVYFNENSNTWHFLWSCLHTKFHLMIEKHITLGVLLCSCVFKTSLRLKYVNNSALLLLPSPQRLKLVQGHDGFQSLEQESIAQNSRSLCAALRSRLGASRSVLLLFGQAGIGRQRRRMMIQHIAWDMGYVPGQAHTHTSSSCVSDLLV